MKKRRITRRDFLRWTTGAAAGAILTACAPRVIEVEKVVKETVIVEKEVVVTPVPEEITIRVWGGGYNPSTSMEVTPENPHPIQNLRLLADKWEELHPGVKIEFVEVGEVGDELAWITTMLQGGTAPEIMPCRLAAGLWEHSDRGWLVNLSPYLEEPNPHILKGERGSERWIDQFYPSPLETFRNPSDDDFYFVYADLTATTIYYNKDVMDELGLEAPKTWAEWMDQLATIKEAGYEPFMQGCCGNAPLNKRAWWSYGVIGEQFMYDSMWEEMNWRVDPDPARDRVAGEEYVRAAKLGIFSYERPEVREAWLLHKEWQKYWPKGWNALDSDAVLQMFLTGKLIQMWGGSWNYPVIAEDPIRDFEVGTFYLPKITKETTPYASDIEMCNVAAMGATFVITNSAVNKGIVDLCVDFLRYWSVPENQSFVINEFPRNLPSVIGARADPSLQPVAATAGSHRCLLSCRVPTKQYFVHPEAASEMEVISDMYFTDQITLDEAMERAQKVLDKAVEAAIAENPEWDVEAW